MSAHRPKISVVIATHNRLPLLRQAVESVRQQQITDWELIVVDDASEDGTGAWLSKTDDPRVRPVLLNRRVERCAARNRGTETASGDYILYLDHDDRLLPRALGTLLAELERHPVAVAATGGILHFDDASEAGYVSAIARPALIGPVEAIAGDVLVATGTTLFRTSAVRSAPPWDDRFIGVEDWAFSIGVLAIGPTRAISTAVLEKRGGSTLFHPDTPEAMRRYRSSRLEAVRRLPPTQRARAERVVAGIESVWEAQAAARSGRRVEGLRLAARVVASDPRHWLTRRRRRQMAAVVIWEALPARAAIRRLRRGMFEARRRFVPAHPEIRKDPEAWRRARRRWRVRRARVLLAMVRRSLRD